MSRLTDLVSQAFQSNRETGLTSTIVATALATVAAMTLSRFAFRQKKFKIIKSPAVTLLPNLSQAEKDALPYPPDAYPGGRDVDSPYGTMRVYEWGPLGGSKVLFVHGITTTCMTVGAMANGMVERGCRVMIFDLWGRGYSDSCADLDHDERLYSTQILLAITSSPLSWTGESGFSLVGNSLGGGISAAFASYFPKLVRSLVLVTPVGLVREERVANQRRIFSLVSLLPTSLLHIVIKRRLRRPLFPGTKDPNSTRAIDKAIAVTETEVETERIQNLTIAPAAPASLKYPNANEFVATQWQIQVHAGFCTSFLSTLRHFPGSGQHESWRRLRLREDKVLVIAGSDDTIVHAEELKEDATELLGPDKLEWRLLDGAHNIPTTHPGEIVNEICSFWKI